ncbi:MAG: YihY/virulence factor BrkB family protein [Oscillospiraceae bacterium]|nr:YihY/virulence factor BrkB family protein [Oscillospiraceae bacterium]
MIDKIKKKFTGPLFVFRILCKKFKEHDISYTGGQIAYFFILSIFPFLIFINSLIASFDIPSANAVSFLKPFFPEQIVTFIASYLEYINSQSGISLLSFGIILAVFSSSKAVRSLINSFNKAYETDSNRGFFAQILFSMLFILLFALILLACIVLVAFGNDLISETLADMSGAFAFIDLLSVWRWITTAAILFFTICIIYKVLPSAKVTFSEALPGTVFSLCAFMILTWLFSLYVNFFFSSVTFYGSIGAVVLLMLWMYFAGIILVLGAELNKTISDTKKDL